MARELTSNERAFRALADSGILTDPTKCRRVVIDIRPENRGPIVHVEYFGDGDVLEVVRSLEGVQIWRAALRDEE